MDGNSSSRGNPDAIFWIALSIALCVVLLAVALGPRGSRTPAPEQGSSERALQNAPVTTEPVPTAPTPTEVVAPEPAPESAPAPTDTAPPLQHLSPL